MFRLVVLTALLACVSAGLIPRLDGRIVGGSSVDISNHPHQISLRWGNRHICGGSLYKANVVITAAHCTFGEAASRFTVVAGTSFRTSGGTSKTVSRAINHPSYNSSTFNNDVSILILNSAFSLDDSIKTIALTSSAPSAGTAVTTTGWGATSEGGSLADNLQAVTVNVVSNADCGKAYGSSAITSAMLCAGVNGGGKDACQGDSGGPLVADGGLVGIVSWGYGCARPGFPGIYSDVAYLKSWIEANS